MRKWAVALATALVLVLATPALAADAPKGTITGQLVNGTKGGASVAGQVVTLKTYINDAEGASKDSKADEQGNFKFGDLSTEASYSYKVTVNYQTANYESASIKFSPVETTKSVKLTVYDATTNEDAISALTSHTVISLGQDGLTVLEYIVFINPSDKTYIGSKDLGNGKKETLRFALPKGASNLTLQRGLTDSHVVKTAEGFGGTAPFIAGTTNEVSFTYKIKSASRDLAFDQVFYRPTGNYDLLVQDTGNIQVKASGLQEVETLPFQGSRFKRLTGQSLAAGTRITVQIGGLPFASGNGQKIAVIVALVVAVPVLGYLLIRRRKPRLAPVTVSTGDSTDELEREKHDLLLELAQLDDARQAGKIPEADYQRLRASKKARLVKLLQGSGGREDGN